MSGEEEAPPPLFATSPANAGEDQQWDTTLTAFQTALAEVLGIQAATVGGSVEEEEALLPAHDAACSAMEGALARVMLAPAPDLAAFAVKLELLFAHALEPGSFEEEIGVALLADARRLAGAVGRGGDSG
jgi:hypothetical protein